MSARVVHVHPLSYAEHAAVGRREGVRGVCLLKLPNASLGRLGALCGFLVPLVVLQQLATVDLGLLGTLFGRLGALVRLPVGVLKVLRRGFIVTKVGLGLLSAHL